MKSYFVTSLFRLQKTKFPNHAQVLEFLQVFFVCACDFMGMCLLVL